MEIGKEKLQELLNDDAFAEGYAAAETKEDLQKLFADHGVELTMEDIDSLLADIPDEKDSDDELTDDALEDVAGGAGLIRIIIGGGILGRRCPRCGGIIGCFGHVCKGFPWGIGKNRIW